MRSPPCFSFAMPVALPKFFGAVIDLGSDHMFSGSQTMLSLLLVEHGLEQIVAVDLAQGVRLEALDFVSSACSAEGSTKKDPCWCLWKVLSTCVRCRRQCSTQKRLENAHDAGHCTL